MPGRVCPLEHFGTSSNSAVFAYCGMFARRIAIFGAIAPVPTSTRTGGDTFARWIATFGADWLLFSPAAFRGGFWERYFDGDAAARNEFDEVVKLIEIETR